MNTQPTNIKPTNTKLVQKASRKRKLAQALKANLKRRKAATGANSVR